MTNDQKEVCNCVDCAPSGADCGCHQGPEKCQYCEIVELRAQVEQERANKAMLLHILHACAGFRLSPVLHRRIRDASLINKNDTDAFIAEVKAGTYSNLAQSYRVSQKIYGGNVDLADELDRMAEELLQSAAQPESGRMCSCIECVPDAEQPERKEGGK